jgi:hypothetical protein
MWVEAALVIKAAHALRLAVILPLLDLVLLDLVLLDLVLLDLVLLDLVLLDLVLLDLVLLDLVTLVLCLHLPLATDVITKHLIPALWEKLVPVPFVLKFQRIMIAPQWTRLMSVALTAHTKTAVRLELQGMMWIRTALQRLIAQFLLLHQIVEILAIFIYVGVSASI